MKSILEENNEMVSRFLRKESENNFSGDYKYDPNDTPKDLPRWDMSDDSKFLFNLKNIAIEQMNIAINDIPDEDDYPESPEVYSDSIDEIKLARSVKDVIDVLKYNGFTEDIILRLKERAQALEV